MRKHAIVLALILFGILAHNALLGVFLVLIYWIIKDRNAKKNTSQ